VKSELRIKKNIKISPISSICVPPKKNPRKPVQSVSSVFQKKSLQKQSHRTTIKFTVWQPHT